jgi:hypothetical protein
MVIVILLMEYNIMNYSGSVEYNIKSQHPVALRRSDFAFHFLPSICNVD